MIKKKTVNVRLRLAAVAFVGGIAVSGAALIGGFYDWPHAIFGMLLLWVIAAWACFGKSDMADTMRQRDERHRQIVGKAREYTLFIITGIMLCGALYEVAHGKALGPFMVMTCLTGFIFLIALIVLRART